MGFDNWGSTRVALPSLPTSDEQQMAQALAEQRSDSRALPGGQRSRRSSRAGALTITDYTVAPVNASYTEGEVTVAGLYVVKAQATVAASDGATITLDLTGAGSGSQRVDYRTLSLGADVSDLLVFANGAAWCEDGVTLSSTISGATVTAHALTYTLIEAS